MSIFSDIGKAITAIKVGMGLKKATSGGPMPDITVNTKTAWASKINWTEIVKIVATVVAMFGLTLDEQTQQYLVMAIVGVGGIVTWILRTWFTSKVTVASVRRASNGQA